jgi:hypothetical protein
MEIRTTLLTWMDRMGRMESLKLISREDAKTRRRQSKALLTWMDRMGRMERADVEA